MSETSEFFERQYQSQRQDTAQRSKYLVLLNRLASHDDISQTFAYNVFLDRVVYRQKPIWMNKNKGDKVVDEDLILLRSFLTRQYGQDVSKGDIYDAVVTLAKENEIHPIRDWLKRIKWDEQKRLDYWLRDICGATDNAYTRAVSRKLLVAAVARIFRPGCKFDFLPILEGIQGSGKSTLVNILAGNDYYGIISFSDDDKKIVEKTQGKWFLEIGEMHGFRKSDIDRVKMFLSTQVDCVRLSYERIAKDYPRQCIFIATMNPQYDNTYLNDDTGNRRFWPVYCRLDDDKIKLDKLYEVRDLLFAEAVHLYNNGEKLWLDDASAYDQALTEQEKRLNTDDPWEKVIVEYLHQRPNIMEITVTELMRDALFISPERMNQRGKIRVGRIVAKMNWEKKRRSEGNREWYYQRKEVKYFEDKV